MRSQKALHPSLRRVAPKIWMRAANVNNSFLHNRFSLPEIDAVGMTVINRWNTRPDQKSAWGKLAGIGTGNRPWSHAFRRPLGSRNLWRGNFPLLNYRFA
jgi:hypothetical protein